MKVIIDRFEGEYAVVELEDGTIVNMLKTLIPENAKEGSIITISCNENETENRQENMKKKMNSIFKK
ncbi:DUF3006 domain-containing protein [Sinanaerobacter sp. ZZT-01]|uniref:DUF3006 domain-containing protein n=1 Tax=Sinanaerobacter sp. ZZT-01 TaxID=3111540 RepID=UPI002D786DB1|nr:DUF3006 domain-containing protein [Sinanaerobacter sp. ZZT-01]WRR92755.1 DUF3006 domain-containing protein [Sinanaerobacter sp. ZZT-01]